MDMILMGENSTKSQAFRLKGRLFTLTVLQLVTTDQIAFENQVVETVSRAPKLFENMPVVFDLSLVNTVEFDFEVLLSIARSHGMIPIAIQGGSSLQLALAKSSNLAILNASTSQDRSFSDQPVESGPSATLKSKLVTHPVRSGQQIVAKGTDLTVTSSVSHGAELLADGSIHVYGALRGRALAGLSGDMDARIYCHSLEAELVSIAGFYRLSDGIEPLNRPCQIYLKDEHIVVEPL